MYIIKTVKEFSVSLMCNEEEIMRKVWVVIPIMVIMIGCTQDPIIGQWERFGDEAAGTIVQVEAIGKVYHGRLLKPSGILNDFGFAEKDVKWLDVTPIGPNKWRGKDLVKVPDPTGGIKSAEYKNAYFTLLGDGVLEIRKFVEEEFVGTVQRWRRIQ